MLVLTNIIHEHSLCTVGYTVSNNNIMLEWVRNITLNDNFVYPQNNENVKMASLHLNSQEDNRKRGGGYRS